MVVFGLEQEIRKREDWGVELPSVNPGYYLSNPMSTSQSSQRVSDAMTFSYTRG